MARKRTSRPVKRVAANPRNDADSIAGELHALRNDTSELMRRAKREGGRLLDARKAGVAAELTGVGQAVRRAAEKLHDQDRAELATLVDSAAAQLQKAAAYLEQHRVDELLGDARGLAQQRPLLVMGGLFAAGLAAGQLLQAAGSRASAGRGAGRHDDGVNNGRNGRT